MNITEYNKNYYHISPKKLDHKSITSEKLQSDVEAFEAAGGKIEPIDIGVSSYKNKYGRAKR